MLFKSKTKTMIILMNYHLPPQKTQNNEKEKKRREKQTN